MLDTGSTTSDPATVLSGLVTGLKAAADTKDPKERALAVGEIADLAVAPFSSLFAEYLSGKARTYAARETLWKSLTNYQSRMTQAACAAAADALSEASATRALAAIRVLIKLYLVHYASVPAKMWNVAYKIHASAEQRGFATTSVRMGPAHHTTTVEKELLRLLMLKISAPDMMTPEQIEVADRAVERLGDEFTLRPAGVADNPFCFEPATGFPPRRARGRELPDSTRYFGPGMGYDSLENMSKQMGATPDKFRLFGNDLPPLMQSNAVQHLLTFWRIDCPYAPPQHAPAEGTIQLVHGFGAAWQYLSEANQDTSALSLVDASNTGPQPPESWKLRGEGDSEIGAEVPQASRLWAQCGTLTGLSVRNGERWIGLIRRMHALENDGLEADIAILAREPKAYSLHEVITKGDDAAFSDAASRQFGMSAVNAIIIADGSDERQPPNILLPAEHWKMGRLFEIQQEDGSKFLRATKLLRHGGEFVRAMFEWTSPPKGLG